MRICRVSKVRDSLRSASETLTQNHSITIFDFKSKSSFRFFLSTFSIFNLFISIATIYSFITFFMILHSLFLYDFLTSFYVQYFPKFYTELISVTEIVIFQIYYSMNFLFPKFYKTISLIFKMKSEPFHMPLRFILLVFLKKQAKNKL